MNMANHYEKESRALKTLRGAGEEGNRRESTEGKKGKKDRKNKEIHFKES